MSLALKRLNTLSEISRDIGQVFFGLMFLGPLITGQIDWPIIISGLSLSIAFWVLSVILTK